MIKKRRNTKEIFLMSVYPFFPLSLFRNREQIYPCDSLCVLRFNIRKFKLQNYNIRILRNTNLYTWTKRYYQIDIKIFSQPEFRNLSTPIKQPIECIQIQTGSLVLILVYIFICLMFQHVYYILGSRRFLTNNQVPISLIYFLGSQDQIMK